MVHTTEELIPCKTRARAISQYVGASISITCEPVKANRPSISGHFRELYRSDSHAMGGVANIKPLVRMHNKANS
jgi:hypothetical protein